MLQSKSVINIYQGVNFNDTLDSSKQTYQVLKFTDFNNIEVNSSWDCLEQTAKVVIPRKIRRVWGDILDINYVPTGTDILNDLTDPYYSFIGYNSALAESLGLSGSNFTPGGATYYRTNPLIRVGDVITIQLGYIIRNNNTELDTIGFYTTPLFPGGMDTLRGGGNFNGLFVNDANEIQATPDRNGDGSDMIFYGYITGLNIGIDGNITIDCEDFMWYLKKARIPSKLYQSNDKKAGALYASINDIKGDFFTNPKGYSINSILYDMVGNDPNTNNVLDIVSNDNPVASNTKSGIQNLSKLPIPINVDSKSDKTINGQTLYIPNINIYNNIDTIIGDVDISNATVYTFLKKLKEEYEIPSFFLRDTSGLPALYCSTFVYDNRVEQRQNNFSQFQFGTNIIDSNLEWKDNSTINAGAIIKSIYLQGLTASNNDPIITRRNPVKQKKKAFDIPVAVGDPNGPQYTFFYTTSNSTIVNSDRKTIEAAMRKWGEQQLNKVAYTGYYGTFTTFLYPYVSWGDIIYISDPNIPERQGYYFVKRVITRANFDEGCIQEITLDFKLNISDPNNLLKK